MVQQSLLIRGPKLGHQTTTIERSLFVKTGLNFRGMNRLTMKLVLLVSCLRVYVGLNQGVCAQESVISRPLKPPYAVVIDTYKKNDAKQMEQRRMFQQFLSRDLVADKTEEEIATLTYSGYWPKDPKTQLVYGCAYCLDDNGRNALIYLRTAPDDYAYRFTIEQGLAAQEVPGDVTDFGYYTRLGATSWEEPVTITQRRPSAESIGAGKLTAGQ